MREKKVQRFELTVDAVHMMLGDSDWDKELVRELAHENFSFKGGLYVSLKLDVVSDSTGEHEPFDTAYVPVARKIVAIDRPPEFGEEAMSPEFMAYRAYSMPYLSDAKIDWGAAFVNTMIIHNDGALPASWLSAGMEDVNTVGSAN